MELVEFLMLESVVLTTLPGICRFVLTHIQRGVLVLLNLEHSGLGLADSLLGFVLGLVGADAEALNGNAGGADGATAAGGTGPADEGALGRRGGAGGLENAFALRGGALVSVRGAGLGGATLGRAERAYEVGSNITAQHHN